MRAVRVESFGWVCVTLGVVVIASTESDMYRYLLYINIFLCVCICVCVRPYRKVMLSAYCWRHADDAVAGVRTRFAQRLERTGVLDNGFEAPGLWGLYDQWAMGSGPATNCTAIGLFAFDCFYCFAFFTAAVACQAVAVVVVGSFHLFLRPKTDVIYWYVYCLLFIVGTVVVKHECDSS